MTSATLELNPQTYFTTIATSPEYARRRTYGEGLNRAIGNTAAELVENETKASGYRTPEGSVYAIIQHVDPFARSQAALDSIRHKEAGGLKTSTEQKRPHLQQVIEFNHAVKELVDQQPNLQFDEVVGFITKLYIGSHQAELLGLNPHERSERLAWFVDVTRNTLNGMRHEIGAEQIIGAIPGVECQDTNVEEEMKGNDLFVTIENREFGVDIKSSKQAVARTKQKNSSRTNVVWSQLANADFGNSFRVSQDIISRKTSPMKAALVDVYSNVA